MYKLCSTTSHNANIEVDARQKIKPRFTAAIGSLKPMYLKNNGTITIETREWYTHRKANHVFDCESQKHAC